MEDRGSQQIRQQTVVTFLNKACAALGNPTATCHMHILFMNAISGHNANRQYADMSFDPAQRGIPAIGGDLHSAGMTTSAQDGVPNEFPVWTSWGSATQCNVWAGQKWFQAEISWNQFLNMLKLATAKAKKIESAN